MVDSPKKNQVKKTDSAGNTAKPVHSVRKIKNSFIDMDPTTEKSMYESVDERLEQLIRLGLGDYSKLAFYRAALSDPRQEVKSAIYREYVADALARLLGIIMSDPAVYNRIKTLLMTRSRSLTLEQVVLAGLELRTNK